MIDLFAIFKNCVAFLVLAIGLLFVLARDLFRKGQNEEKNNNNNNVLKNVRKAKKIEEDNNKLTRDQRIDRM